jgi:hypothetical protein
MSDNLCEFIRVKIAEVEKSIRARKDMQRIFSGGTDSEWEQAAALHPSTVGNPMKRTERLKAAYIQERILVRLQAELTMFKAVLKALKLRED